ncbi:RNA methyltransferase [Persicobacter psychrovividus]|uniref:RNA methyltransferase n=2 Tax=Persicobacter psychrovividus TaxID=387638 RepID=A0ABM7VFM0_9BACT|nr:RNA methyltransferase [Persicobacter psychrovividus]
MSYMMYKELSKRISKLIKSLQIKKYRKQEHSFFVEGAKNTEEILSTGYKVTVLVGTADYLDSIAELIAKHPEMEVFVADEKQLGALGTFATNNAAIAVAEQKDFEQPSLDEQEFALVLDDVRDPGNLGTIIRIADWYGIKKIIASPNTADFHNPKVLNASMGSFSRVSIHYTALPEFLAAQQAPIYGALLEGDNIYNERFDQGGFVIMGNESIGISDAVKPFITHQIHIPRIGGAESLNVAIATAVICDNIRRP